MKKTFNPIEEFQGREFNPLNRVEADSTWNTISARIETPTTFPIAGLLKVNRKPMIPLLIGALLFASAGGTVAASNSAVPGDTLFGIDRAVESVRIAFAGDASADLKLKFAEERLSEVQTLVDRARAQQVKANATTTATTTTTTTASNTATTTASTTPKQKSNDNIALGVNVALAYLNSVSLDLAAAGNTEAVARLESVIDRLETIANSDDVRVKLKNNNEFQLHLKESNTNLSASSTGNVKINTNGNKSRIEVREDGERFRIEIKDGGDIKIKLKSSDDDNNDGKDEDEDKDEDDRDDDKEDDDEGESSRGRGGVNLNSNLRIDLR